MLCVGSQVLLDTRLFDSLQRVDRRDDAEDVLLVGRQLLADGDELRPVRVVQELVDRVALVHRDDGEHRLATEELLVRDVVLVDLVGLVQVGVLARR